MKQKIKRQTSRMLIALAALFFAASPQTSARHAGAPPTRLVDATEDDFTGQLKVLDDALAKAQEYSDRREDRLDSIRGRMSVSRSIDETWNYAYRLGEEWLTFNADSALHYSRMSLRIAGRINRPDIIMKSRLQEVRSLCSVGLMMWAQPKFRDIDGASLSDSLKLDYWLTGRHFSICAKIYAQGQEPYSTEIERQFKAYDDSLSRALPPGRPYTNLLKAERLVASAHYREALVILSGLFDEGNLDSNIYGMATYRVADVYKHLGDEENYAYYLVISCVSDVRRAVREGWALPELAIFLYRRGNLDEAYRYINFAFRWATQSSARIRTLEMASAVPMIDEAYRRQVTDSRDELMIYVVMVTLLFLLSLGLMTVLWRHIKRGRVNARKLAATSRLQESYIGNFVGLCSSYAERLDTLQKLVTRKLAAGQGDELLKMVKSGRVDEGTQDEDFYRVIDGAFLDLYPDFVTEMNALLRPDERIELREKGQLTSELRIYAMVRLGVDESTRIARILRYSVNTVYAYRNKMRSRAINRETFDGDVRNLGRDLT